MTLRRHGVFLASMFGAVLTLGLVIAMASVQAADLGSNAPWRPNSVIQTDNSQDGVHVFFLRRHPIQGFQQSIQLSAYYPSTSTNWNDKYIELNTGGGSPGTTDADGRYVCEARPSGNATVNNQYVRVTLTDATDAANRTVYYIRQQNVCANANASYNTPNINGAANTNRLYARYSLPARPANVDSNSGMYKLFVSIEYNANVPEDAGGIRLRVAGGPTSDHKISQRGGTQEAFPIVSSWDYHINKPGPAKIDVPFGTCTRDGNANIGIYDADNGVGTFPINVWFRIMRVDGGTRTVVPLNSPQGGSINGNQEFTPADGSNANFAGARFTMEANVKYEMQVKNISLDNTIDIQLPSNSESVFGDSNVSCQTGTVTPPPNTVVVVPRVESVGAVSGAEVGDPLTFRQYARVLGFPANRSGNKQWGWNELASQVVSLRPNGNYRCANPNDPQNINVNSAAQARQRCDHRCLNGAGEHAPYATNNDNRWGSGDKKCYVQPTFLIACVWNNGEYVGYETVTGDGDYCQSGAGGGTSSPYATFTVITSNTPGQVCATSTPTWGLWQGVQPGHGVDGQGNIFAPTWNIIANPPSATLCGDVGRKPYVKVFNGDVVTGAYANYDGTSITCPAGAGTVSTYNKGSAGTYGGSGVTDGLVAAGNVEGFRSANTNPTLTQKGLTFANNGGSEYGGQFGTHSVGCPRAVSDDIPGATRVTQSKTSDWPATIIADKNAIEGNITVYHDGDLYINNNLIYSNAGVSNVESLPRLRIIVRGDIYINRQVTRIDGIFMAVSNGGTGGNVYTCSAETGGVFGTVTPSQRPTACGARLTINGALVAKSIKFHRTPNTLRDAGNETPASSLAGEIINYTPSVWLPRGGMDSSVESITSLPPIL